MVRSAGGVNEDPVTGSAHTFLAPLWSENWRKNPSCPARWQP
ncbi:PhzF family phenazine biosynthesis protein [Klebsiella variicola subsp. variicola]|nr:PhzF family phenazine biosynthesis protein [Klebsiella variicola subsp. variicola]